MKESTIWILGFTIVILIMPWAFAYFVIDKDNFIRRRKRKKEKNNG